jgi:CubicO group peptidase (beta-lactamase class C family)
MVRITRVALSLALAATPALAQTYPGATWTSKTPAEVGMDVAKLDQVRNYLGGRGFLSRYGYQVYSWGSVSQRADIASACKPFFAHFLFKAVEEGRLANVDVRVNTVET